MFGGVPFAGKRIKGVGGVEETLTGFGSLLGLELKKRTP
jgi:hypothetical protein